MAKTKRHEKIRQEKLSVRSEIDAFIHKSKQISRVPERVIKGSHGTAIAWKAGVQKLMSVTPPRNARLPLWRLIEIRDEIKTLYMKVI